MARWDAPFEVEQVKQLALIARLPTHHGKPPPPNPSAEESLFAENHETFFNSIGQSLHIQGVRATSFACLANRRTSPAVKSVRTAIAWPMANDPPFATFNHFAGDL
jgi:hypothetical protein